MTDILSLLPFSVWAVVKLFFVIGLVVYVIFALVVVKQTNLMTSTVEMGFETPVKLVAWVHLIFAIAVLLLSLIIL